MSKYNSLDVTFYEYLMNKYCIDFVNLGFIKTKNFIENDYNNSEALNKLQNILPSSIPDKDYTIVKDSELSTNNTEIYYKRTGEVVKVKKLPSQERFNNLIFSTLLFEIFFPDSKLTDFKIVNDFKTHTKKLQFSQPFTIGNLCTEAKIRRELIKQGWRYDRKAEGFIRFTSAGMIYLYEADSSNFRISQDTLLAVNPKFKVLYGVY